MLTMFMSSQSPHPGQSGGYYINATPNQMIQMAQPTPQTAPPVLQATNSDQANQRKLVAHNLIIMGGDLRQ